ncbi:MAG: DUF2189 domain-containing protein [Rhizobiaceae bacterium]
MNTPDKPQAAANPANDRAKPVVNRISISDVTDALRNGVSDFFRAPLLGLFFGGFFALGGLAILYILRELHQPWLILPIAIGFPLVGPFVAVGTYETSRRLAAGEKRDWGAILGVVFRQRERELAWMAFVVLFVFWVWLYQIRLLTALFLGFKSMSSIDAFISVVLSTSSGINYLIIGTIIGAILAIILFATTVVSIPLLMERELDFVTAIITSVRSVMENPVAMLFFGFCVSVLAMAAMIPAFLGLFIVFPILGHATWHLYKRVIS